MEGIFVRLLNMSISASILILAVILLRLALRKAPRWIICLLWALVAVRLMIPFNLTSPFSAYEVIDPPVNQNGQIEYVHFIGQNEKPKAVIDRNDYKLLLAPEEAGSVIKHNPDVYLPPVVIIWECGMAFILLYAVFSAVRLKVSLRASMRLRDNIYLSDSVKSPFIFGVINPRIYLGSGTSEEQMEYIIEHEQAHLRRKDHLWKPLGYALLCVYWFNPLCWVAYILLCRDIELACDEKVIRDKDLEWKKTYSETLLACSMYKRRVLTCPLAFGEVGVKTRIKQVLHYKKPAFWLIIVAVVACIVTAVCFLTNPSRKEKINGGEEASKALSEVLPDSSGANGEGTVSSGENTPSGAKPEEMVASGREIYSQRFRKPAKVGEYGEYGEISYLNFNCALFEHGEYEAPKCGEGTPEAWRSLGGVGTCFDSGWAEDFEVFENGDLVGYNFTDNHMNSTPIATFRAGGYSGCMYKQTVDLFTHVEILLEEGAATPDWYVQSFWVIFFTEGEGSPLYVAFYNCDYFSPVEALTNTGVSNAYLESGQEITNEETLTFIGTVVDAAIDFKEPTIMVDVSNYDFVFDTVCFRLGDFAMVRDWEPGMVVQVTCLDDFDYFKEDGLHLATLVDIELIGNDSVGVDGKTQDKMQVTIDKTVSSNWPEDENLGIFYTRLDMGAYQYDSKLYQYKKTLIGRDSIMTEGHYTKYVVLTNNDELTWEEVHRSLFSSDSKDFLTDTLLIGMTTVVEE